VKSLVAVLAAFLLAVPATAHAAGADFFKQTPSGNILCEFGSTPTRTAPIKCCSRFGDVG
jgi:hypothetical protein